MYRVDEYDAVLITAGSELIFQAHHHCGVIVAIITQLHAHIPQTLAAGFRLPFTPSLISPNYSPHLVRLSHRSLRQQNLYCYGSSSFQQRFKVVTVRTAVFLLSTNKGAEAESGLDVVICVILNT